MENTLQTEAQVDMEMQAVAQPKAVQAARKRVKMFDYDIAYIGIVMIAFAFIGFLVENLSRLFTKGILDSRFMIMPFIGFYGLAVLAIYIVLGTPQKPRFFAIRIFKSKTKTQKVLGNLIYFAVISLCIFFGEVAVGITYEYFTGVVLWDYTTIPLNFTKYTSIPTTAMLGVGVYLLMRFGFAPFMNMLQRKMNYTAAKAINLSLGMLIVIDCAVMMIITFVTKEAPMYWSIKLW